MRAEELMLAASRGSLATFMAERSTEITPQLAEQASELAFRAITGGDLDAAELATSTAANVWLRLGDYKLAITNVIDMQHVSYMRADKPEHYALLRTKLLDSVARAMQVGARPAAFKAATIAADCSYWSALAAETDNQDLILQTLRDVISAAEILPASLPLTVPEADAYRFVTLTAAVASTAMSIYFRPARHADEADKLLCELASSVARLVPIDFAFEQLDEKGRAGETAQTFASLADHYGS